MPAAQVVIRIRGDAFDPGGPLEDYDGNQGKVRISVATTLEEGGAMAGGYSTTPPHANGPHARSPFSFDITVTGHIMGTTEQFNDSISPGGRSQIADLVDRQIVEVLVDTVAQSVSAIADGTIA